MLIPRKLQTIFIENVFTKRFHKNKISSPKYSTKSWQKWWSLIRKRIDTVAAELKTLIVISALDLMFVFQIHMLTDSYVDT